MCILSYLPAGVLADQEGLYNGGVCNPHGHGWALVADDSILTGRSLDLDEALETFVKTRLRHPHGPALFHSRWATHGSKSLENCHPFAVGGSQKTVVAHNGVLHAEAHPGKGDDRSDTRLFADELLPTRFRRLDRQRTFAALSQWCGSRNKLVILTVDPRYRHNVYVVNEDAGQWDGHTGLWHSNGDYLERWWLDDELAVPGELSADEGCLWCGELWVDPHGYCAACLSCQDCGEFVDDCLCWCGRGGEAGELVGVADEV